MTEKTKSVRMAVQTIVLVKVASARAGESMQAWVEGACRARLEREGKTAAGDRVRVATVAFEEP